MSHLTDYTRNQQAKLAAYCRDGEQPSLDGATPERIPHYRRLVFGIVRDALERTYPLTKHLLTEKEWGRLVNVFFEHHACAHPQVWRMPEELIAYAKTEHAGLFGAYPQLSDLLDLEWLEVELYMMPDQSLPEHQCSDPLTQRWRINPEYRIMHFDYPVHQKNARFISLTDKGIYHCLGFRNLDSGKVRFVNLSPLLVYLIQAMQEENTTPADSFAAAAEKFGIALTFEKMEGQLLKFYEAMTDQGLLI